MDETHWKQVNITFPLEDHREREQQAISHLARTLPVAENTGLITSWFFIRKGRWRIRYLPADTASRDHGSNHLPHLTQGLDWTSDIYEPETHAFGGTASMDTAHKLFHADSHHLLTYLSGTATDRKERSLILCTALMRAAGLDFGEQGDVWARIAQQRSAQLQTLPEPPTWASSTDVRYLLLGRARPEEFPNGWLTAFEKAGSHLKVLRERGHLTRGIRAVIALHVIFHWNRIGLPGPTQAVLAQAAKEAIFDRAPAR
jgi:thiopeptide-type bacteriocin biosynthesis protein